MVEAKSRKKTGSIELLNMVRAEQERVRQLLTEAVGLLCRNSLQFDEEVQVEGLIGITLDKSDILLVSIRETFESAAAQLSRKVREEKAAKVAEERDRPSSLSKRKRQRSCDSDGEANRMSSKAKRSAPQDIVIKSEVTDTSYIEQSYSVHESECPATYNDTCNREPPVHPRVPSVTDHKVSLPQPGPSHGPDPGQSIAVKEEVEEEDEECFMISDEDEDVSNQSDSFSQLEGELQQMAASQNWPGADGGFSVDGSQSDAQLAWPPVPGGGGQYFDKSAMVSAEMLAQGQISDQDGNKGSECPICRKFFYDNSTLRKHIKSIHLKQKPYMCPVCGARFSLKHHMQSHISSRHGSQFD